MSASGVQLHITSLPSGKLGPEAYAFVDWLATAGQSYWQVLPLGPPDRWRSPYKSRSAFACWPRLLERPRAPTSLAEEADFRERERFWIDDWAAVSGGRRAIADQVRFEREWLALRRYASEQGVRIIGDLPLYVAAGSVDVEHHPKLFVRDLLAGAPPDDFSPHGQLWGNPVYNWQALRRSGYRWWVERLRRSAALFDLVRFDHFRGLVAYWAVPAGSHDARGGRWRRGPLAAPLLAARRELGMLPLVAEDLGVITEPVEQLRRRLRIPGMEVLQFVYDPDEPSHDPLDRASQGRILYTGTHDQDTLLGWWDGLGARGRAPVQHALRTRGLLPRRNSRSTTKWALIGLAHSSPAPLVMMQAQDLLGLPSATRMNTPGRAMGNWRWQIAADALTPRLARELRAVTCDAGR